MFKKSKVAVVALTSLLLAACGGTQGSTTSSTTSDSTSIANPVTVTVTDDTVKSTIDSSFLPGVTAQRIRLTVWSETESHPLFKELISEFAKKYYYDESSNAKYEFIVTIGDEFSDAATKITQDLDVAPDVFGFPDDQLGKLVDAGAIQEITGSTKTWVNENNVQASVSSATYNNKLYAFPQTADNGYFLYYNKNYLTADDVKTFDGILAKLESTNQQIVFPFEDAWYIPSFFFNQGNISYDPATKTMTCDFDNTVGLEGARGFANIVQEHTAALKIADVNSNDALFATKDSEGQPITPVAVAGVTGTWNAGPLRAAMGDGYAATKLPTFTPYDENGTALAQRQMGSFAGSKLIGTKAQDDPDKLYFSSLLAKYLTSEDAQVRRFQSQGFGPSNVTAQNNPAVLADVAISALNAQAPYAVSQSRSVGNTFWDPTAAFGKSVVANDYGEGLTLADALAAWVAALTTPAA